MVSEKSADVCRDDVKVFFFKKVCVLLSDVVVIVGDLTDSQVTRLRTAAEPLALLRPRLGSYFATGQN